MLLGNLFLAFSKLFLLGLFYSLEQKFGILLRFLLVFLSVLVLHSDTSACVLQDTWNNKMLNLA